MNSVFSLFLTNSKRRKNAMSSNRFYSFTSYDLASKYEEKTKKFKNIFPFIYDLNNLEQAWYEIKTNSSNIIKSESSNKTLRILKLDWFKEVSEKLELGTYSYRPLRKVFIPKLDKVGKRTLTMISPKDKVIQRAFLRVLQPIYEGVLSCNVVSYEEYKKFYRIVGKISKKAQNIEKNKKIYQIKKWVIKPIFHEDSFGYRPNRSPHLALKKIKQMWNALVWFWSADLIKVFENINQHKLINEIEKTIDDPKLVNEF